MPKIGIECDEVYPYYFTYEKSDCQVEVTQEEYTWIKRTEKRVDEVQRFLKAKEKEWMAEHY